MGWDYYTYMSQPTFFIEAVKDHMVEEQRAQQKAQALAELKARQQK